MWSAIGCGQRGQRYAVENCLLLGFEFEAEPFAAWEAPSCDAEEEEALRRGRCVSPLAEEDDLLADGLPPIGCCRREIMKGGVVLVLFRAEGTVHVGAVMRRDERGCCRGGSGPYIDATGGGKGRCRLSRRGAVLTVARALPEGRKRAARQTAR
ncbi:hypothetical protein FGB62_5g417 [Gracilaria domingensis]|nr:hypothetical protein FGB62_5g417 [Gracilaria domingensis]